MVTADRAFDRFANELHEYKCTRKIAGGVVMHLTPLGDTDTWVGTLTAYDKRGLKSEEAIPFKQFIKLINEIEKMLDKYHGNNNFYGALFGWNPSPPVRDFLYSKKVHRVFFLREEDVTKFAREYTTPQKIQERESDVLVILG